MAQAKLYYGDEPYRLVQQRELLKQIDNPEMNLYVTDAFDQEAFGFAYQVPFLADKRVIIVELETCSESGLLTEYLQDPAPDTELHVFVKQMDLKSALAKTFPGNDICEINKYSPQGLADSIFSYVKDFKRTITKEACVELIERIQYRDEDKSFFDVKNALNKLCAASDSFIEKKLVEKMIPRSEKENVFGLMQMILNQQTERLYREAELILGSRESNAIQVLNLLLRNYRIAMKASMLGKGAEKEIGVHPKAVIHMDRALSMRSMDCIQEIILGMKTGRYKEKEGLILCLSKLTAYAAEGRNFS